MKITVTRCYKPPGLIVRAKMYYLELNDKGLYMIELGNASAMPRTRNQLQQMVAEAAVDYFDAKYEKDIVVTEQRLQNGELDQLATEKRSYFLQKNEVTTFTAVPQGHDISVRIKGGKADLKLIVSGSFGQSIQEMMRTLGKK
jgi:hypothetical protein